RRERTSPSTAESRAAADGPTPAWNRSDSSRWSWKGHLTDHAEEPRGVTVRDSHHAMTGRSEGRSPLPPEGTRRAHLRRRPHPLTSYSGAASPIEGDSLGPATPRAPLVPGRA